FKLGDPAGAIPHLVQAVHALPDDMSGPLYLARAYAAENKSDEAIRYYQETLRLAPDNRDANYYLGCEWLKTGNYDKAITRLNATTVLAPSWPAAHFPLAVALAKAGRTREAIAEYRELLQLSPESAAAYNNLAWILATSPEAQIRNGPEAVRLAQRACELSSNKETIYVGTLAVAYAAKGDFDNAVETANEACALATRLGETNLLKRNEALRTQFKKRIPYQETSESAK
ncbi:MAG TPA: tetratricopeptide repeat protein, partial [Verrucomicrobiae bacterium]|nr:tetratricopeptide repeat protein [Verrucomicrobiae bacterium]